MRLARALAGCALLATLILLSSDGVLSQEKKEKEGKLKGQLPQGWAKLDLTAAQKEEIYKLNREYREKTDKLNDEIKKLNEELAKKRVAVLTDEQRKKLIDLVAGDPKDKPKEKDGSKEKAKAKEPDKQ
jgi:Spy/CpxP family protein refolding chaperone